MFRNLRYIQNSSLSQIYKLKKENGFAKSLLPKNTSLLLWLYVLMRQDLNVDSVTQAKTNF